MADSFWAIPDVTQIRTPLSILREQASALTQETKGVLVGQAEAQPDGGRIRVVLDVVAPGLNDYRYRVLEYTQPLEMYPGQLNGPGGVNPLIPSVRIQDEPKFIDAVKEVLSSPRVKNVLASLLAQVSLA